MSKKVLTLTAAMVVGASSSALAAGDGLKVTVGGSLDAQVGVRNQKSAFNYTNADATGGNKLRKAALVNDTKLNVDVNGHKSGLKYGGKIILNADTSANKYGDTNVGYQTLTFVEHAAGRLEAGSATGAYDAMRVSGATIARATGGANGDAKFWWNPSIGSSTQTITIGGTPTAYTANKLVVDNFIASPDLPSNYKKGKEDIAAKVTYYTPTYHGLKAGVTYTPDTEQRGTVFGTQNTLLNSKVNTLSDAYKDVWSGGFMFHHKLDKVHVKASLLGETGKAKDYAVGSDINGTATTAATPASLLKRHKLQAWEAGASISFMGFTVAGSWGDWGKSGLSKAVTASKKQRFWTAGAAYEHSHFAASVSYFESKRNADITNDTANVGTASIATLTNVNAPSQKVAKVLSIGIDYKLAPGFLPYVEVSKFTLNDKTPTTGMKNSGNIFLAGTKLQF